MFFLWGSGNSARRFCVSIGSRLFEFSEFWHYLTVNHPKAWIVDKTLEAKAILLCFCANMPFFKGTKIGYVNFTDCLEIRPEDCQDTNLKKAVLEFSVFQNGSPAMASVVTRIGKISINKGDRTNRNIEKYMILNINLSGLKLCKGFICEVRFNSRSIRSNKDRPFVIFAPHSVYNSVKLKRNNIAE